jgi:hypothetical protein
MLNLPANTFAIAQGFKRTGQQNALFIDYQFSFYKRHYGVGKKNFGVTFF